MNQRYPQIAFVLGKPVREGSVFPEVFEHLRRYGLQYRVHLPHEVANKTPSWLKDVSLIVNRGLNATALSSLASLERAGFRCCNRIDASLAVQDRSHLLRHLGDAGLPIPEWMQLVSWSDVLDLAGSKPIIVKAVDGSRGRGVGVAFIEDAERSPLVPFPGPYIVQRQVVHDGWDRKVYVVGNACRGLLKPWPRRESVPSQPFVPNTTLGNLALTVGQVLNLDIYGVDFLEEETGPVIVDVNVFPGFKGVPQAAQLIGDYLKWQGLFGVR